MAERIKTPYKGVFYRDELRPGSKTRTEKVYYIRYRTGGRETGLIEEKLGKESGGMTAARANQVRALRISGKELSNQGKREAVEAAKREEAERPTIARLWDIYAQSLQGRPSIRNDDYAFHKHIASTPIVNKTPDELVTLDLERLRFKLLKTLAPQTTKYAMAMIRRAINYGVRMGLCRQPDSSKLHYNFPKIDNIKTESMSREQMISYLDALNEEPDQNAAGLLRLALLTGMRRAALLELQWTDVDFETGFITLRGDVAKNEKTERIPLSSEARTVLENIERFNSPFVFPGPDGKQRKSFQRIPRRVRAKAGLPDDWRPMHGLRHTFASLMASSGAVDLYTLQKLLTHRSPEMTQRYAHLADEALQRAATVADDVFRGVSGEGTSAKVLPFKKAQAE
ncbi:MAG: site-specific integrase [Desulfovibrio sp.]|jgi:integrase|nr:site-specific integrase [Desulfovibrio sp.]